MASVKPGLHQPAVLEALGQAANAVVNGLEPAQDLGGRRHADIVFGEIDAGFEQRDQFQQLLLERRDAARDGAVHLLRGDARLIERGGFDQVAHGFGLRQIDAAVEESAQGELAGLGQARAGLERALHGVAQHDRRAVAGDLDHVFGGVRARRGEERDHHLVDRWPSRRAVARAGHARAASPARSGMQDALGDGARACARRDARRLGRRGRAEWRSRRWCR